MTRRRVAAVREARRPRTRTRAVALDLAAVLLVVALLSVPHVLTDNGLVGAGSATEPPDAPGPATPPADAVPPGPVRPVDDEPLVASRDPFQQLVMPEPPSADQAPPGEDTAGAPESPGQPPDGMAPVELPEPQEQAPPSDEGTSGDGQAPPEGQAPSEDGRVSPSEEGRVSPSDERVSTDDQGSSSQDPPPVAAGPEGLRLERITVDKAGVARAHITVGGERYTPAEGEEFGPGYRLAEIDAPCVEVVRGDERERLCEDDRVFPK